MSAELLPCPFCNESAATVYTPTCDRHTPYNAADRAFPLVRCACGVSVDGIDWDQSGRSAIAAWNRRASLPSERPEAEDARLREALGSQLNHMRKLLESLEYKQTGRDPKTNGFAYAAIPEWSIRQRIASMEAALAASQGAKE